MPRSRKDRSVTRGDHASKLKGSQLDARCRPERLPIERKRSVLKGVAAQCRWPAPAIGQHSSAPRLAFELLCLSADRDNIADSRTDIGAPILRRCDAVSPPKSRIALPSLPSSPTKQSRRWFSPVPRLTASAHRGGSIRSFLCRRHGLQRESRVPSDLAFIVDELTLPKANAYFVARRGSGGRDAFTRCTDDKSIPAEILPTARALNVCAGFQSMKPPEVVSEAGERGAHLLAMVDGNAGRDVARLPGLFRRQLLTALMCAVAASPATDSRRSEQPFWNEQHSSARELHDAARCFAQVQGFAGIDSHHDQVGVASIGDADDLGARPATRHKFTIIAT